MNLKLNKNIMKIHFIGIGGIGMSGIAELLIDYGYKIQGSDIAVNSNIKRLKKKGAKIFLNHRKSNTRNISLAIYSSAIKSNNPEIIACKKLSIPMVSRAEMLAELMRDKNGIAIAGSHGKTTTTSLVGTLLVNAKLDPTIINGGIINSFSKNNRLGKSKLIVVEADESDGSFLKLPHLINIVTNIDIEHLDYYKTKKKLINSFENFITNIPIYGYSIICIDNDELKKISKKINKRKIITYGFKEKVADIKVTKIVKIGHKTNFSIRINKNVIRGHRGIYNFTLNLLGEHNVLNATASIISSILIGVSIPTIRKTLNNFKGIKRRFTYLGKIKKSFIYDDYAHHPTEIKASYEIAKSLTSNQIIVVFQPHRFSRTKELYSDFVKILKKIDILYIYDVYPAGEKKIKEINSNNLVKEIKKKNHNVFYLRKKQNIFDVLTPYFDKKNLIVFMGAGSITYEAKKLIEIANVRKNIKKI